jgi:hypothetical protein
MMQSAHQLKQKTAWSGNKFVIVFLEGFSVQVTVTVYWRYTIMKMNGVLKEGFVMFAGSIQLDCDVH